MNGNSVKYNAVCREGSSVRRVNWNECELCTVSRSTHVQCIDPVLPRPRGCYHEPPPPTSAPTKLSPITHRCYRHLNISQFRDKMKDFHLTRLRMFWETPCRFVDGYSCFIEICCVPLRSKRLSQHHLAHNLRLSTACPLHEG